MIVGVDPARPHSESTVLAFHRNLGASTANAIVVIRVNDGWDYTTQYLSGHDRAYIAERERHRLKAIAAFPVYLDAAAEPVDVSERDPEPRIPTARRSGCRARGRRPLRARPGRRRKLKA